jgi:hypothetical protein
MMVVTLDYRFKPDVVVLTDSATVPGLSPKKLADGWWSDELKRGLLERQTNGWQ